ncbi:hypothetical protein IQ273_14400 [Nodosilinea sp. LEGE 07298]|uniref:MAE_28990/MAE_18760 family HEPN-like nuclease n=1 Tax=Nodosilinea sp. LEGE 07298 TaxID=2777970 RepID=UPI001881B63C|nr:MAE_28990/MAE_18760 family HEPN-like nuclease [Nodosilinea sp. LEGE 07298]MBE9110608.1 hypothetical protein [Nodosilinea sp. LEGE 07298]
MSLKSQEQLIDFLAEKSQIRRRELFTFSQLLKAKRKHELNIICRSSIVIAYANWEGFVKEAATAYVDYVACKSLVFSRLSPNFQAIACRAMLLDASRASKRITPHLQVVTQFVSNSSKIVQINPHSAIDTESNLNSEVLENICITVGIDYHKQWSTWGPFVDELVKTRCAIAHGTLLTPDDKYALEAVKFVEEAITWFKTDIENSALATNFCVDNQSF